MPTPPSPPGGPSALSLSPVFSPGVALDPERLFERHYEGLKAIAARLLSVEYGAQSVHPTGLVHELYERLVGAGAEPQSEGAFIGRAARSMRQILIDRARARRAIKRGGGRERLTLSGLELPAAGEDIEALDLHVAIERLGQLDEVLERIVELRFFAGLSVEECGTVLNLKHWDVKRKWSVARMLLSRELRPDLGTQP